MRLIDADVFDAIINDDGTIDVYATETARNAMLSMPTVDAVPVVRCKDCKYWGADGYRNGCKYATCIMMENDYCSMAEREEE